MDLSLQRAQTATASRGPRPQFIKVVGRQFVLQLAMLAFASAVAAHAAGLVFRQEQP